MLEFEYWTSFIEQLGLPQSAKYFIDLTNEFIQPVPGMIDLLAELRDRDIKLAICSNNTEFWFTRQMESETSAFQWRRFKGRLQLHELVNAFVFALGSHD